MGMAQMANSYKGIRAAVVESTFAARMCRAINNSNVLTMGGFIVAPFMACEMVDVFLNTQITDCLLYTSTHGAFTGVSNVPILQNLESLIEMGKQIIIRVPFLPEYNGTEENLMEMAQFMNCLLYTSRCV